jgi:YbgC/YbaW family acyl-CoA thioester hydrolase
VSIVYERAVRFEEVDAAGILFFGRFFNYCHEGMERFFDGIPGGYVGIITQRKIGFPAVHVDATWKTPLKYGDVARIEVKPTKVGNTSCTFRYDITRPADSASIATIDHVVVATDLVTLTKVRLPDDCRKLLEAHRL